MTNADRIKGHLSAIAECTGNLRRNYDPERAVENDEVTQYLQTRLDAIKELLEPESETLAASVLRLADTCNLLERENEYLERVKAADDAYIERLKKEIRKLQGELTDVTLSFNDAHSACRKLEEEIMRKNDTLKRAHSNLAWFKKAYEDELTDAWARAAHRKKLLADAKERIEALKKDLATTDALLDYAQRKLDEKDEELDAVKKENATLKLVKTANHSHIEELQKDLTSLTRQNWRRGK